MQLVVAAAYAAQTSTEPPDEVQAFLQTALAQLYSGRWWLTVQQRKLYGAELATALARKTGHAPEPDSRLAEVLSIERLVRRTGTFRQDGATRLMGGESGAPILLVVSPSSSGGWNGAAFMGTNLARFATSALSSIRNVSYPLALQDSTGGLLWGDASATKGRAVPLQAVSGWRIWTGPDTAAAGLDWRWRWYGVLALLVTMIAFGIAMTTRIVRREMELSRLQSEFAAGVTHEFKSPITGIRLLVERIAGGRVLNPNTVREYCEAIQKETGHLEQMVNRLLETHRIQTGQKRYNLVPHCVTDIVEGAIAQLRTHAEAKRIDVRFATDDATREIGVDRSAIHDVIENLLDNAIKYSPPETAIDVSIRHANHELILAVRDQGIGIDAADKAKVFDHFFRGQRGQAQAVSGTGLGLALVKAAAEGHGGSVEVESAPGMGSEFRVRIPIGPEEAHV